MPGSEFPIFKVGDEIVCIKTDDCYGQRDMLCHLTVGKRYVVTRAESLNISGKESRYVYVEDDRGEEISFYTWRFKLARKQEPPPEIKLSLNRQIELEEDE